VLSGIESTADLSGSATYLGRDATTGEPAN
jgi:hypothetical protein